MAGKKGRSGPRKGSLNALKNGSRLELRRLTVGELPPKLLSVRREGRAYRRTIEAEVLRVKGQISLTDGHLIDTASAATIQAGILRWLLRNRMEQMSPAELRQVSADIVRAKERRDAAIKALLRPGPPADPWEVIDSPPSADGAGGIGDK